jgi:hypothetical protein
VHLFDRDGIKIDVLKTAHIDGPHVEGGARSAKRQDSAGGTEVILRRLCVLLIERQILKRGEETQIAFSYPVDQRSAPAADRTIAHAHMIKVRINLEFDAAAMTRAIVCLFHQYPASH